MYKSLSINIYKDDIQGSRDTLSSRVCSVDQIQYSPSVEGVHCRTN